MTRQSMNQSYDQKKGSADRSVSGQRQGMPGASIGRSESKSAGSRADYGGPEGNSRDSKSSRNGSRSNQS